MDDTIKLNEHIIVQRQSYMKIHKLTSKSMECRLGKLNVDLNCIVGEPYWSTFIMETDVSKKNTISLSKCKTAGTFLDDILKNTSSGADNRDIVDDGSSQKLSTQDIVGLKEKGLSAQAIVGTLIENSKTFASKTEYSQEKYLKKKEKKYSEYIIIRKPNYRLVSEILLKGPSKQLGLRMDTLAQLTTIACVRPGGNYIVYESGCQGLVLAASLTAIGPEGTIIHVHGGNVHDRHAVNALNLPLQRLEQIQSLHISKLTRKTTDTVEIEEETICSEEGKKRKAEDDGGNERKKAKWEEIEEKARTLLFDSGADGIIFAGKEHPSNILKVLFRFLKPSRPFVVFCSIKEPLQELFADFKKRSDLTALRLTESWLRNYQVLTDRTHPDINMSGTGGYLLSGITVS